MLSHGTVWLSIFRGFLTTVRISTASLALGTLLAVPLCALRFSKHKMLSWMARTYIALLCGTPVTTLLMLFFACAEAFLTEVSAINKMLQRFLMVFGMSWASTVSNICFRSASPKLMIYFYFIAILCCFFF